MRPAAGHRIPAASRCPLGGTQQEDTAGRVGVPGPLPIRTSSSVRWLPVSLSLIRGIGVPMNLERQKQVWRENKPRRPRSSSQPRRLPVLPQGQHRAGLCRKTLLMCHRRIDASLQTQTTGDPVGAQSGDHGRLSRNFAVSLERARGPVHSKAPGVGGWGTINQMSPLPSQLLSRAAASGS